MAKLPRDENHRFGGEHGGPAKLLFRGVFFVDHSLSHFDARSTRKQWAREVRRGLENN